MAKTMWKVSASADFVQYMRVVGQLSMTPTEHRYLGHQLTSKNSVAQKVEVNENEFIRMNSVTVEGREFFYEFDTNSWFVKVDTK